MDAKLTPQEALRLCRERAGLTQGEAQLRMGVAQANLLSLIENSKRVPNAKLARKIEALFGIPVDSWKVAA